MNNSYGFNPTLINVPNHSAGFNNACAFRLDEETVVVMGGIDTSNSRIKAINAYNVKTGQWSTIPYNTCKSKLEAQETYGVLNAPTENLGLSSVFCIMNFNDDSNSPDRDTFKKE